MLLDEIELKKYLKYKEERLNQEKSKV